MYPGASLWQLLTWTLTLLVTCRAADTREAWGDWLLVDDTDPGTSILLRRITPKSVFVAPTFNGCSEGYQQDSLGRCVKLVKVNQQAQWNFFLERLNSMYAPSSTSKKPQKEAGPFHISLPIGSESSHEDSGLVRKRVPLSPVIRDDTVRPTVRHKPQYTTTLPPTTITATQEPITLDYSLSTMVDYPEISTTERDFIPQTESTTEAKRATSTIDSPFDPFVMLGDQPFSTEDTSDAENRETPKIHHQQHTSQLPDKPFVIIVTNEPTAKTEETAFPVSLLPITTTEMADETYEVPTTTETSPAGTTETNKIYLSDVTTPRIVTEVDTSASEAEESDEYPKTTVRTTTVRPRCSPAALFRDNSDCELATESVPNKVIETTPSPSASIQASAPLIDSNFKVRFPSDTITPVRKTPSYVRFPETSSPHDDRPAIWWPSSWQVRRRPSWSASSELAAEPQQYPAYAYPWTDSSGWRRRYFSRD